MRDRLAPDETTLLVVVAVAVGLLGGFGAILFRHMVDFFQGFAIGHGEHTAELLAPLPWWRKLILPVIGFGAFSTLKPQFFPGVDRDQFYVQVKLADGAAISETERVAMRIGAALNVTLNIPYTKIGNAMLDLRTGGTGTIALETIDKTRLSYLTCWPHVRPWYFREAQPALRCIPEAEKVASILSEAAEARVRRVEAPETVLPGPEAF